VVKVSRTKRANSPPKTRGIRKSDWCFSGVKDEDIDWVCTREYSKECLRAWDEGCLDGTLHTVQITHAKDGVARSSALLAAIRKGIETRAAMKRPQRAKSTPIVEELPPELATHPAQVGSYSVCLRIDWRAGNKKIKTALEDWLEDHVRSKRVRSAAVRAYMDSMWGILNPVEGSPLRNYEDLAATYFKHVNMANYVDLSLEGYPTDFVIKELRRGVGVKPGRGDTKRAMLSDLAVARLHWSGKTAGDIQAHLGKALLKSTEPNQIRRAARKVQTRLRSMITAAAFFESGMMLWHEMTKAGGDTIEKRVILHSPANLKSSRL
jgi:hypothetical protein